MSDTSNVASCKVACAGILVADLFVPPLNGLPEAGKLLAKAWGEHRGPVA